MPKLRSISVRKKPDKPGQTEPLTNHPKADFKMDLNDDAPRRARQRWWHWRPTKKQLLIAAAVVIVAGVATGIWLLQQNHNKPTSVAAVKKSAPNQVTTVASPLTGIQVAPAIAKGPVTAVMVENSDQARPQSGLSQAGVVYEALAEGGITRFMTLYQEDPGQIAQIGPVRSARPYFIDWLLPFNAAYAHVGGSPAALSEITALNVRDMNQFYNGNSYTRISSRIAPHNVYTSIASLSTLEQAKGWATSAFTGFPRKAEAPTKSPATISIDLNLSTPDMAVHYQYDPTLNSYQRSEGGSAMVDANTNKQLEPKVVIAIVVPWTDGPLDASGAYYTDYSDTGNGAAFVFQDGKLTLGEWIKSSQSSQIQFVSTDSGSPISLNAGQTWITAVGDATEISYK
jgi:hypothetical protein